MSQPRYVSIQPILYVSPLQPLQPISSHHILASSVHIIHILPNSLLIVERQTSQPLQKHTAHYRIDESLAYPIIRDGASSPNTKLSTSEFILASQVRRCPLMSISINPSPQRSDKFASHTLLVHACGNYFRMPTMPMRPKLSTS